MEMKDLVAGFAGQLKKAVEIGKSAKLTNPSVELNNVTIFGLGGSGIGGTVVSELVFEECTLPITVCKGYFVPGYVNENSLVIISSYSGDTEETLMCMQEALSRNAKVVCVTSGGQIEKIAREKNLDLIKVPGGFPPRSCLGYSLTQLCYILKFFGVSNQEFESELQRSISYLEKEEDSIKKKAKQLAEQLNGTIPVIYTTTLYEGVAIRFRQQLNENSKLLCWHHVFPEMNHNELVGWTEKNENLSVVILSDQDEYSRNKKRIEISREVFGKYAGQVIEIFSEGSSKLEKSIYLIHLCDWVSCYLADLRNVDAIEIRVINHLKSELSKL